MDICVLKARQKRRNISTPEVISQIGNTETNNIIIFLFNIGIARGREGTYAERGAVLSQDRRVLRTEVVRFHTQFLVSRLKVMGDKQAMLIVRGGR